MRSTEQSHPESAGSCVDLDHTSFAVHDALDWGRYLRRELGATPIIGEVLPEFRYLLFYVGSTIRGARIELIAPTGPGFLQRNLEKRGEGPHHLTFTVPDLSAAVAEVQSLGLTVVGEHYEHPPWREAFIMPDSVHGVVVQLAQSDRAYPSLDELLSSRSRNVEELPSPSGATDPQWWTSIWDVEPAVLAELGTTHVGSTDLAASQRLFGDVLGGSATKGQDSLEFSWPSGSIRVKATEVSGVHGMSLQGVDVEQVNIGRARLGDFA